VIVAVTLSGKSGAHLLAVDTADGAIRSGYKLHTVPVFDGMIAADGRLYVSLVDGTVTCLGNAGEPLEKISEAKIAEYNSNRKLRPPTPRRRRRSKGPGKARKKK